MIAWDRTPLRVEDAPAIVDLAHRADLMWLGEPMIDVEDMLSELLAETFPAARDRGLTEGGLSTDTRTGALGLYQRLGMEVQHTIDCWTLDLDPV